MPAAEDAIVIPRIGLSTYREPAAWGVWNEPADLLPANYAMSVEQAGGAPLLLPPSAPALAPAVVAGLDGVIISGGADVEPARYDAQPHPETGSARRDRDAWELALIEQARRQDRPVLAICRGLQVLNVAFGGDLVQHLPDTVGSDRHCPSVGVHGRHRVRLAPDSRIAASVGTVADVATYHHQAVGRLGRGVVATGWAEDGVIEAIELADGWVVGVQWHPETQADTGLFRDFVRACGQRAERAGASA